MSTTENVFGGGNVENAIGVIFAIDYNRKLFDIDEVRKVAENCDVDIKYFKDNKKETAFGQAITAMTKYFKKRGYVLHKVSDDNASTVYALDKKIVSSSQKDLTSSDTNSEVQVIVDSATYETIANFIYDKTNDRVLTDSQERLTELVKVLNIYINSYTKAAFTAKLHNIVEQTTKCKPWRKQSGVYFVPIMYKQNLDKVIRMASELDSGCVVRLGMVPSDFNSRKAIVTSVDEEMQKKVADIRKIGQELYDKGNLSPKQAGKYGVMLGKWISDLTTYKHVCSDTLKVTEDTIKSCQDSLLEVVKTGKLSKPLYVEPQMDEELADLLSDL